MTKSAEQRKLLGILGHKLAHTLSPVMHTASCNKLNLNYTYGVLDISPEMLAGTVSAIRKTGFRGINVTVPYKQSIMPLIDEVTEEATIIGAVNTIVNDAGKLIGYNTDVFGVQISLKPYADRIQGNHVIVFGAGGAARAVCYAVAKYFTPKQITVANRTSAKAEVLANEFSKKFPSITFFCAKNDQEAKRAIESASVIINTTTLGMSPQTHLHPLPQNSEIHKEHIVFDIVYNPIETTLLKLARKAGATAITGIEMLIGQGAKAFELFTQQPFPTETARDAVFKELTQSTIS